VSLSSQAACASDDCVSGPGAFVVNLLNQLSVFAESRGEGLHPKLRALLERAVASPFSELSVRRDGLIQAGPSPESETVSPRGHVMLLSREPARPVAASKPDMRKLSTVNPKRERMV
jgi:hypothetical protein